LMFCVDADVDGRFFGIPFLPEFKCPLVGKLGGPFSKMLFSF
jgi:hypothetical protein